jgi:hypothetical protein
LPGYDLPERVRRPHTDPAPAATRPAYQDLQDGLSEGVYIQSLMNSGRQLIQDFSPDGPATWMPHDLNYSVGR